MKANKKKLDLVALSSIPLIMTLANSMLIPILPLMQRQLKISALQTSLIITVYAAFSIVCIPIAGYLSDRVGRKRVILISLSIVTAGGFISGLAAWLMNGHSGGYAIILTGRAIQGIGAAGAFPIVIPLVGDMFKSKDEVSSGLGMIETSNTFGKVLSPILGSALALVVWFLPLAIVPVISVISILAVGFLVKIPKSENASTDEKAAKSQRFRTFIRNTASLLSTNRWLYAIFTIGCLVMFTMFGFLYFLSSTLEDNFQTDGIRKGFMLAIPLSAICVLSYFTGKIIGENKRRMKALSVIGLLLLMSSMLICGFINPHKLWLLITLILVSGIGIGLVLPSLDALITEGIEKKQRGTITSLYSSARFIGVALGPLIASVIHDKWLFYLFAGCALVSSILAIFTIKPSRSDGRA
ncbi:MFS transporter [Paenibacillus sp. NEAU-GSW1]|uniref:MFS transporter n=1 Tax=Paenibacillus sp. NEAU-GSW1 TaxID=2682486 RepID=UPI0012E30B5F|nr:MFS transporter [Paenibacillus sp. NEAU-GSW1]MUT64902.1 MFS transporter [Paenibacillus sp. NEAU-GSW1]